jgi:hypothetical protein
LPTPQHKTFWSSSRPNKVDLQVNEEDIGFSAERKLLTRFDPGNAHAWGLLRHGAFVGSGELDGDQTAQGDTGFTQVRPPCRVQTYWYVSNVSIIFDAPCLFIHHLLWVLLHFMAFLCIFRN